MNMKEKPKLRVVVGPTGVGKTGYAISLAHQIGASVVSADSRQVYAGMNIGTATPRRSAKGGGYGGQEPHDIFTPDRVDGVDHYLLNIARPDEPIVLAQWQGFAFEVIDHIIAQGKVAILVGGTMLYVDSVVYNYEIPEVAPDLALRARKEKLETEKLYGELMAKDPGAAEFIEPHHKQRIIRALEVIEVTGRPFSESRRQKEPKYDCELIGLFPTPDDLSSEHGWGELKTRIEARSRDMFGSGLIEETKILREQYGADLPLLQTMGYKQAGEVLDGKKSQDSAVNEFCQMQFKYARRQMSWWRRNSSIHWVAP